MLAQQGKWAAAEAAYRETLRLQKNHTEANAGLRNVLAKQNKLSTAEGIRLQREEAVGIYNRGNALFGQRKLDEAIAAYRKALDLDPGYPEAHCNLGHALRNKGRFAEALVEFKKGHELGSRRPNWSYPSAQWVAECERLVALDARLPAILKGEAKAKDWNEQFGFANLCSLKGLPAAAARLYQEGLTASPERTGFRLLAASAAALAGCGSGDAAQLDDKERGRWRKEALSWLRADLEMWRKALERNTPQARKTVQGALGSWKGITNFAGLRDAAALAKLPAAEREAWQQLWAEVETLLQQTQKNQP